VLLDDPLGAGAADAGAGDGVDVAAPPAAVVASEDGVGGGPRPGGGRVHPIVGVEGLEPSGADGRLPVEAGQPAPAGVEVGDDGVEGGAGEPAAGGFSRGGLGDGAGGHCGRARR